MSEEQPAGAVVDAAVIVEPENGAEPAEGETLGATPGSTTVIVSTKGSAATPDEKKVPSA